MLSTVARHSIRARNPITLPNASHEGLETEKQSLKRECAGICVLGASTEDGKGDPTQRSHTASSGTGGPRVKTESLPTMTDALTQSKPKPQCYFVDI